MTFNDIKGAVKDYCNLSSSDADTRVGKAINRHYRRVTSQLGLNTTRFVTRSAATTIGVQTVTFAEIEKIDRILDVTTPTAIVLLQETSIHEIRSAQPGSAQPLRWAVQNTDADAVTVLLDTTSATSSSLQADGWTTLADLSSTDEPVFPESFHDILVWSVISEELLKKEKGQLSATYEAKADRLLAELRFHLADSPTRVTQQAPMPALALAGTGGGSGGSSVLTGDFVKGGVNVSDYASLALALTAIATTQRTLVIDQSTVVAADTTIPENVAVFVDKDGGFTISSGKTLTINGTLAASRHRIFSGSGTAAFGGLVDGVFPEWWATNTTPGTTDMLAALNAASATGRRVLLGMTTYGISGHWTLANGDDVVEGIRWTNEGTTAGSEIKCLAAGACVYVTGLRTRLRRLSVNGNSVADYGIYFADSGGQNGFYDELEIWGCLGTPGAGIGTVDRNNNWSFYYLKSTGNKIGASFIGRCEKTTLYEPQLYGNLTTNLVVGDDTFLVEDFRIYGGQFAILGTEGGPVTNIAIKYVKPMLISGALFESANATTSSDLHVLGTNRSIVRVQSSYIFGNNVVDDAIILTAPTVFSLADSYVTGYTGYPIADAGTSVIRIENCLIDQVHTTVPVSLYQSAPALLGVDPMGVYTGLVAKLNVGDDDTAYALVLERTGTNGDVAGVLLGTSGNPGSTIKAGLIFEQTTTSSRGSLSLCVNTAATSANVTKADARLTVDATGAVAIPGALTLTGSLIGPAEIYRPSATSFVRVSGGDAGGSGANLLVFGQTHATSANKAVLTGNSGVTIAGQVTLSTIGAFAASDKYLIVDSSGNIHKSALGPAS